MSLFCDHDWQPRTGLNSGSYCPHCHSVSDREVGQFSALGNNQLAPRTDSSKGVWSQIKDLVGCDHHWLPRSGMDSGSYCSKCHSTSSKEVPLTPEVMQALTGHLVGDPKEPAFNPHFTEGELDALAAMEKERWAAMNQNAADQSPSSTKSPKDGSDKKNHFL